MESGKYGKLGKWKGWGVCGVVVRVWEGWVGVWVGVWGWGWGNMGDWAGLVADGVAWGMVCHVVVWRGAGAGGAGQMGMRVVWGAWGRLFSGFATCRAWPRLSPMLRAAYVKQVRGGVERGGWGREGCDSML